MEAEERAKSMGWVPSEEFKGDPEKWVDAETFLKRGDEILPIMKERLSKMEGRFQEQNEGYKKQTNKIEKLTESLEKFAKFHKDTAKRSYERAIKDLKKRQRSAVEEGNVDVFDNIETEIEGLQQEIETPADDTKADETIHPDFNPWMQQNPWYGTDPDLTAYANGIGPSIARDMPDIDGKAFYEEITKRTKKMFPYKFKSEAKADSVEGGGETETTTTGKKKGWKDLPQEAKNAYNKNFADIPEFSKEDYAKDYWIQEEE